MRYIFFLVLIASSCQTRKKNIDCERFKTGVYTFTSKIDDAEYIITRTDSIQTETNASTGAITRSKIKWTGRCSYELLYLHNEGGTDDEIDGHFAKTPIKVKITQAAEDYYVFEGTQEGTDIMLRDTLWVIQNHIKENGH